MVLLDYLSQKRDPDRLFSYNTRRQVLILDRWLGLTANVLTVSVFVYILGYVFHYEQGYLALEQARGSIATHVWGDMISVSSGKPGIRFFTAEDLTYPGLENGNVFVTTRMSVHSQERSICEDKDMPCQNDDDCSLQVNGKCSGNGFCEEPAWCDKEKKPEVYAIDAGNLMIWVKSSIEFFQLNDEKRIHDIYSTEKNHPYPEVGYNTFAVRDLLLMCEPPVRFEEVAELGASVEIMLDWRCSIGKECHPVIHAKRLDTIFDPEHIGFMFKWAEYVSEKYRVLNRVKGIRIFFRTSGVGRMISIPAAIQRFTLNSSLVALAVTVADLLMLRVYHQKKKYAARKFEESPDFSEYMGAITNKSHVDKQRPKEMAIADAKYHDEEEAWKRKLEELEG